MMEFLSFLGFGTVGGIAVLGTLAVFAPALLPAFAVRVITGLLDALVVAAGWMAGKLNDGGRVIFASAPATFTLMFAIILSDIVEPIHMMRPLLPSWLQSEKAPERKEATKAKPKQTRTASAPRPKSTLQEIKCALTPGAC
jgi:hypothetical protein